MISVGAFAAAFDDEGRVLCVRHQRREQLWGMPGGKIDPGEDPLATVKREVMEEAACGIEVETFVGVYSAVYKDELVLVDRASDGAAALEGER